MSREWTVSTPFGLHNSALSTVIHNNVIGFTIDSIAGLAQICLEPSASQDLVVCAELTNTILNQGTDNTIIGWRQPTNGTGSADPAIDRPQPDMPKVKHFVH